MIICDTSGLLALLDESEPDHTATKSALQGADPPYVVSPFVLAELDYLIGKRGGPQASRRLLNDVAAGAFQLESFGARDLEVAITVLDAYPDFDLGLTDASLIALAERLGCRRILTLDQRHFRVVRSLSGSHFQLLPADLWLH